MNMYAMWYEHVSRWYEKTGNQADDEVKDDFYEQLQNIVDEVPRHGMLLVIGDWMWVSNNSERKVL